MNCVRKEERMIRVLHVLDGFGSGGAESFVLNLYRNIDREIIQFDFLLRNNNNNEKYLNEVKCMGGRVYVLPSFEKNMIVHLEKLKEFFEENQQYKIVHVHASTSTYYFPLLYAKKSGIPIRILHSHNAGTANKVMKLAHYLLRRRCCNLATDYFTCSSAAGDWMFGKRTAEIIYNAIDIRKFRYDGVVRDRMRNAVGVDKNFVIGHTGRFVTEKNHKFMLELAEKVCSKHREIKFVFVGEGPLLEQMKEAALEKDIRENVLFLGVRTDLEDVLQMFDLFLFPSISEGLGIALVEAQANGLPCIVSENIPELACVTPCVKKLALSDPEKWESEILNMVLNWPERFEENEKLEHSEFNIRHKAKQLEAFYKNKSMDV